MSVAIQRGVCLTWDFHSTPPLPRKTTYLPHVLIYPSSKTKTDDFTIRLGMMPILKPNDMSKATPWGQRTSQFASPNLG